MIQLIEQISVYHGSKTEFAFLDPKVQGEGGEAPMVYVLKHFRRLIAQIEYPFVHEELDRTVLFVDSSALIIANGSRGKMIGMNQLIVDDCKEMVNRETIRRYKEASHQVLTSINEPSFEMFDNEQAIRDGFKRRTVR